MPFQKLLQWIWQNEAKKKRKAEKKEEEKRDKKNAMKSDTLIRNIRLPRKLNQRLAQSSCKPAHMSISRNDQSKNTIIIQAHQPSYPCLRTLARLSDR
jgi:hypothetical protein